MTFCLKEFANEDDPVGRVLGYTIIVTEDYTKNTEGDAFLPGWRDVQKFSVWPPYQVCHKVFHLCPDDLVWICTDKKENQIFLIYV
jgi:hypothetical protein